MLTPIFEDAKNGNGLIEYLIKCDEENNTTITIDRNELHVSIAVKPVKSIEYIVLNFGITNQSTSVSEEIRKI
jgi:phage tail sheath protein FI